MAEQNILAHITRWIARIWGSCILAFILLFLIADLFGTEQMGSALSAEDKLTFVFFPLSTLIGLGLAWKWEAIGGLITVLGMIGLMIVRPDLLSSFWLLALILIPGLLFLVYWFLQKNSK